MKTRFDTSFVPPAPIAIIAIRNIQTGERVEAIEMLLDTGADVSILPLSGIEQVMSNKSDRTFELVGFDGSRSSFPAFDAQIVFLGKRFSGKFFGIHDDVGILGRDILNQVSPIFDGPNLEWVAIDDASIEQIS